jgi:hypothetical protein
VVHGNRDEQIYLVTLCHNIMTLVPQYNCNLSHQRRHSSAQQIRIVQQIPRLRSSMNDDEDERSSTHDDQAKW